MKHRIVKPTKEMEQLRLDVLTVLKAYPTMDARDYLVIMSQIVGQLVALQDQRKYTSEAVMTMVSLNIQEGNKTIVDKLMNETGGKA